MHHQHIDWQHRLNKETGNIKRYTEKAYESGNMWHVKQKNGGEKYMPTSYPMPYTRTNQNQFNDKTRAGFINDSSGTNPSDPSSMCDQGKYRNGPYSFPVENLTAGKKLVSSAVPKDKKCTEK